MVYAQTSEKKPYRLHGLVGAKYVPNVGGVSLGVSLYSPDRPLGFSIRNDILLALGQPSWTVVNGQTNVFLEDDFQIMQFWRQNYVEAFYNVLKKSNKMLAVHLGYGYIRGGKRQTLDFIKHSYSVATVALHYSPDNRFNIEMRGDMPLSGGAGDKLWAASIALLYDF